MLLALAFSAFMQPSPEASIPPRGPMPCARRSVPRGPCGDLRPVFEHARNYPAGARRARAQGRAYYHVRVGRDGRVTACEITRSTGSRSLDEATCRILRQRMLYDPARDAQGRRVPGEDTGYVAWRLPRR